MTPAQRTFPFFFAAKSLPVLLLAGLIASATGLAAQEVDPDPLGIWSGTEVRPKSGDTSMFKVSDASAANDVSCNKIDFEGLKDSEFIGTIKGPIDVVFGPSWLTLIDADAGGAGNFANEPSPSTTATFINTADPINFSKGVQFVELFYVASQQSVPLTLKAWSQQNGTGTVVDSATSNVIGTSFDGAPCTGDPTGQFCLFTVISLTSPTDNIRSITLEGAAAVQFGFDDMTFCTAEPRVIDQDPERSVASASSNPSEPQVIHRADGSRVVVWAEDQGSRRVIRAQLFNAQDTSSAGPLLVSTSGNLNSDPTAAIDDLGNLAVFWSAEQGSSVISTEGRVVMPISAGSNVVGRFFNPDLGAPSSEVVVSTGNPGESKKPEARRGKDGGTIVTWDDGGKVRGRLLERDGTPKTGAFPVSSPTTAGAATPDTATSATGEFVTVWRETSGNARILAQRFAKDGAQKGAAIVVTNSNTAKNPSVATSDNGDFVVAWEDQGPSGSDIFKRLFRSNGTAKGAASVANSGVTGEQVNPAVDANAVGDFIVVWESSQASAKGAATGDALVGRLFNPQGEPERADVDIAEDDASGTPKKPDASINDKDDITVVFERRGGGGQPAGVFRKRIRTQGAATPCTPGSTTLCLNSGRFRVSSTWRDPISGNSGVGRAVKLTNDTGYFWFFDSANVEIVIKTLDACSFANAFWAFAAGLTNVEVNITLDDTSSGESVSYFNQAGAFQPVQDTQAFRTCSFGNSSVSSEISEKVQSTVSDHLQALALTDAQTLRADATAENAASLACSANNTRLCLSSNRFSVNVDWETDQGTSGPGRAVKLTNDTGYFWFFDQANVELIVKVLDACSFTNRYWAFAGGLTDVKTELVIEDTNTGSRKVYRNPLNTPFKPVQDTNAFSTCP